MKKIIAGAVGGNFFNEVITEHFCYNKIMLYDNLFIKLDGSSEFRDLFPGVVGLSECPGGYKMHHAYAGGLLQHYREMIDWMLDTDMRVEFKDFSEEHIVEAVILHDISKPLLYRWSTEEEKAKDGLLFRYIKRERNVPMLNDDLLTCFMINYFKLDVSFEVFVAIMFAEGGWSDAAKMQGCQPNQLGYFLHMADLYSSQFLGGKFEAGGLAK